MRTALLFIAICTVFACCDKVSSDGKSDAFIRDFYAGYLKAQNMRFEPGVSKDDAGKALDSFLRQNLTDGMRDYYARYYAVDSLGESICCDCDLFTQVQDDGGMDVSSMLIEEKEKNWYSMTHVWRDNGKFRGGTFVLLKLAEVNGELKIDSVVPYCNSCVEKLQVYEPGNGVKAPEFKGGRTALADYVAKAGMLHKWRLAEGGKGDAVVRITVNNHGWVESATTTEGLAKDEEFDVERLMKNMPRWTPGSKNGEAVCVRLTLAWDRAE